MATRETIRQNAETLKSLEELELFHQELLDMIQSSHCWIGLHKHGVQFNLYRELGEVKSDKIITTIGSSIEKSIRNLKKAIGLSDSD